MKWLVRAGLQPFCLNLYCKQEDTREKIDIDVLNKEIAETVVKIDHLRAEIDKIVEELGGKWWIS